MVATPISDQSATEDTAFTFQIPTGTFTDADGDTLSYSASLSSGAALPSWLSFDAATQSFSGTPSDAGIYDIRVTASDGTASVSDDFTLTVNAVNNAPVPTTMLKSISPQAQRSALNPFQTPRTDPKYSGAIQWGSKPPGGGKGRSSSTGAFLSKRRAAVQELPDELDVRRRARGLLRLSCARKCALECA